MIRTIADLPPAPVDADGAPLKDESLAYAAKVDTPWGAVLLAGTVRGLARVAFHGNDPTAQSEFIDALEKRFGAGKVVYGPGATEDAARLLVEYMEGKRELFAPNPPNLDLGGTEFQARVWNELRAIPFGSTVTYGDISARARADSPRAVGQACGANPVLVFIPCHRVIESDGGLGGYAGGLEMKRRLLAHERIEVVGDRVTPKPATKPLDKGPPQDGVAGPAAGGGAVGRPGPGGEPGPGQKEA